ncbi:choice-of-anchor P family protein [Actinophytocola algeriensis]|uniref:Streptogramin lyase n=1 Tax=Actinophytocola algeriensis TaxID=1768010 RepID=A0A7W7VDB4_9PSEU|nr:choice-of-anchor P family protein [Actinophytocola algeriensis]MBB4905982.1 streptogramin lyase [Actinophytocola algeriensis]MBE1472333.1 streptogramin lyase [Actinophytocola algeriensis]
MVRRPRWTAALASAVLVPVVPVALATPAAAVVAGTNVLYTVDAQFDEGVLQDVNHDAPNNDQLQLDRTSVFFPYVNIAASGRGTMVRIDVNTGETVGEWFSAPSGRGRDPSRTTVDRLGNTWFSNRAESSDVDGDGNPDGSITRVGVVVGGTRANADGSANPAGDYLAGPFAYNTCVDRDEDGLIATSRGLGDIRPWTNAGGADNDGGVATAADECLINYTRVAGTNTRTVAVDANNDVWTGGADTEHEKVSGGTGDPVPGTEFSLGCGGYGGLIDQAGTLWSARYGNNLLRYVPSTGTGACLDTSHGDYGLGIDPMTGHIWHTTVGSGVVKELDPATGNVLGSYPHGNTFAQGVAVDRDGNVWVAHSILGGGQTTVGHLRTDGTFVGNVTLPGGAGPTGVAVDTNGKIWVANLNTNNAMRIDPDAGPIGGDGFPVGAVDLTVDLGAGAAPYNYSDMTGSVLGEITAPVGTWSVVQDGGVAGQTWGRITWNTEAQGSVPPGTSITLEARASDTEAGLAGESFVPVGNGTLFSLTGRYIEARATLTAAPDGTSPVLSDVRIQTAERSGVFSCQATALNLAGIVVARANPPDVPCVDDQEQVADVNLNAGILTVRANVLDATTDQTPDTLTGSPPTAGDKATATARVDSTKVTATLVTVEIGVISSTATAECVAGPGGLVPQFTGSSTIASLKINGVSVTVGSAPLTIPLLIGSLRLNSTTTTATSVTQQAVVLDTLLTDVVIGEAKANVEGKPATPGGNPCAVA